jgi:branched-chain amino acid transport system substrate-binding protein
MSGQTKGAQAASGGNMSTRIGYVAAALSVALTFGSPASAEIRIGSVLSTTGPASFLGEPERQTLELYVSKINAAGGINGERIKLISYDDASDANQSRTFATRLVEEDKVDFVVAGSGTGYSLAMLPIFEEAKIPFISLSGGVEIVEPVRKWVFKPPHTDRMACQKIFEDMRKRGLSKAALIAGQGGFAKSMAKQCRAIAPEYKVEILAEESYGPRDSDMTPQLNKIAGIAGVEAVINPDIGQSPAIVTRNFKQLGIKAQLYLSHAAATLGYLQAVGAAGDGILIPGPILLVADQLPDSDPQKAILLDFTKAFVAATGKQADTFGGYAHDGILLLVDAIKRAGSTDRAKVRDALEATKGFVGTVGAINMSPTDHLGIGLGSFRMFTVKDGRWIITEK